MIKVGQLVRGPKDSIGVVLDIVPSRRKTARFFGLNEARVYQIQPPMAEKTLWMAAVEPAYKPASEADLAAVGGQERVDEVYRIGRARMEDNKARMETNSQNRRAKRATILAEKQIKPGTRVLVRGRTTNWPATVKKINASGRVQVEVGGQTQWVESLAIIRSLDPIKVELPCSLSENTLDQLQERGWSQFQIGQGINRQAYVVAFTRDDVATKGDNPSPEADVNFDPGLGLHWRPV